MLGCNLTAHPGFKRSYPFHRLSPSQVDMLALADAIERSDLYEYDPATETSTPAAYNRHNQRAILVDVKEVR